MPYVPLALPHTRINAVIAMATEPYLQQAHHLLAATYVGEGPSNHFGTSAAVMTLLAVAAASSVRYFDLATNDKRKGVKDRESFVACVERFFPWDSISIKDDQLRSRHSLRRIAAEELYTTFRNPLIHIGGMTSKLAGRPERPNKKSRIVHTYPGLRSLEENEQAIAEYCGIDLAGDTFLEIGGQASTLYTRPLYWCARRMIQNLASDEDVQRDVQTAFRL